MKIQIQKNLAIKVLLLTFIYIFSNSIYSQICDTPDLIIGEYQTVCIGQPAVLGQNVGCDYCYKWEPETAFDIEIDNNGNIINDPTITPNPITKPLFEDTQFRLIITNSDGAVISNETVNVYVSDLAVELDPTYEVCAGEEIILTPSINEPGYISYEWSTGETSESITVKPDANTVYSVTVTSDYDCKASTSTTVIVHPENSVEINPSEKAFCDNVVSEPIQVPQIFSTYNWTEPSGNTSTGSHTINANDFGVYKVEVTDVNGCTAQDEMEVFDINRNEKELFESMGFYPIDITIIEDPGRVTTTNCDIDFSGSSVNDGPEAVFELYGNVVNNLGAIAEDNNVHFESEFGYNGIKTFITNNDNLCDCSDYFDTVKAAFEASSTAFWFHLCDDPNSDDDILFVLANVPSSGIHHPIPGDVYAFVDEAHQTMAGGTSAEDFFFEISDRLLDNYYVNIAAKPAPSGGGTGINGFDTDCISTTVPKNFLSPSGTILQLPVGSTPIFSQNAKVVMPGGVMVGFSNNGYHFSGRGKYVGSNLKFSGYYYDYQKSVGNQSPHVFTTTLPTNTSLPVTLGYEEGKDSYNTHHYDPSSTPAGGYIANTTNNTGEGIVSTSFTNGAIFGDFSGQTLYSAVQNQVTAADLEAAADQDVWFNPFGNYGILYAVRNPNTGNVSEWVYAKYEDPNSDDLTYYKWNCDLGFWQEFTPEEEIEEIFGTAEIVYDAIIETLACITPGIECPGPDVELSKEDIHTILDFAGMIPIIGVLADAANSLLYIQEGDYFNASLSFAGVLIEGVTAYRAVGGIGALKFKIGDDIPDGIKMFGNAPCLLGNRSATTNCGRSFNPSAILNVANQIGMDASKTTDLMKWLLNGASNGAYAAIRKDPNLIKAWDKLYDASTPGTFSQLRDDPDMLRSLTKALDDSDMVALNIDELVRTHWVPKGFGCPTCTGGKRPYINDIINNLIHFKKYRNVDGYQTVLNQVISGSKNQIVGGSYAMRATKKRDVLPTRFEDLVSNNGNFTVDIRYADNPVFVECKSWGGNTPNMSNVPDQMVNYFHTQTSLSNFEFLFDATRWKPVADNLNAALKARKSLFRTDPISWGEYNDIFQFGNDVPFQDVDKLIDFITENYFDTMVKSF